MKKMIALVAAALVTVSSAMSTQAMTMEDIAAQDDRVTIENGQLTYYAKDLDDVWNTYYDIISENVRSHSGYEYTWVSWDRYGSRYKCKIGTDSLNNILNEQAWVEEWCQTNVPTFVPNGVDQSKALDYVLLWIAQNCDYDYELSRNLKLDNIDYQNASSAFFMIQNKKGVCVGLSQLFRVLAEAIPFNTENGLVDWNCTNPKYIKVATVENKIHMWNEVQEENGEWKRYDATSVTTECVGELYDTNGEKYWHY